MAREEGGQMRSWMARMWRAEAEAYEPYDVLVLGTMSSGKTAFINALIGQELLPSANEATTACITSVEHRRGAVGFKGACYSASGNELAASHSVTPVMIREWNANSEVRHIRLSGNFRAQSARGSGLVLHDTPGPNNSQDEGHAQCLQEALHTLPFDALFYLLNVGQLGINDDRRLLGELRKALAGKKNVPVYFILNKIDLLDPEKGEDVGSCIEGVCSYLTNAGFDNPVVIPVTSYNALCVRKALIAEPMTRAQRLSLHSALDEISESCIALGHKKWKFWVLRMLDFFFRLSLYRRAVERRKLLCLNKASGLVVVDALLKDKTQIMEAA